MKNLCGVLLSALLLQATASAPKGNPYQEKAGRPLFEVRDDYQGTDSDHVPEGTRHDHMSKQEFKPLVSYTMLSSRHNLDHFVLIPPDRNTSVYPAGAGTVTLIEQEPRPNIRGPAVLVECTGSAMVIITKGASTSFQKGNKLVKQQSLLWTPSSEQFLIMLFHNSLDFNFAQFEKSAKGAEILDLETIEALASKLIKTDYAIQALKVSVAQH